MPDASPASSSVADIRIREAQSGDLDDLAQLENATFSSDRLTRRQLAAHSRSRTADLLVAHHGDELAGYVLVLTRRGSRLARLYSLAVAARWTGLGLGSRLLAAGEAQAGLRGAEALRLEVRADNRAAIRLYERTGYELKGRKDAYYADGLPALCYERCLRQPDAQAEAARPRLGRAA